MLGNQLALYVHLDFSKNPNFFASTYPPDRRPTKIKRKTQAILNCILSFEGTMKWGYFDQQGYLNHKQIS